MVFIECHGKVSDRPVGVADRVPEKTVQFSKTVKKQCRSALISYLSDFDSHINFKFV